MQDTCWDESRLGPLTTDGLRLTWCVGGVHGCVCTGCVCVSVCVVYANNSELVANNLVEYPRQQYEYRSYKAQMGAPHNKCSFVYTRMFAGLVHMFVGVGPIILK